MFAPVAAGVVGGDGGALWTDRGIARTVREEVVVAAVVAGVGVAPGGIGSGALKGVRLTGQVQVVQEEVPDCRLRAAPVQVL